MFYVSEIQADAPLHFQTPLQRRVYTAFDHLQIPFARVGTDEAITMADCAAINEKLGVKMVKTLFLCNRRQTDFYLFVTGGGKPFRSKDFSAALGISRVSFAPAAQLEARLGTKTGAATVLSCLVDHENTVRVVLDRDVLSEEWYGCSDGTTTGYLKLRTDAVCQKFLPYSKHAASVIAV